MKRVGGGESGLIPDVYMQRIKGQDRTPHTLFLLLFSLIETIV